MSLARRGDRGEGGWHRHTRATNSVPLAVSGSTKHLHQEALTRLHIPATRHEHLDGEAHCAAHLDPFCPLFSASCSRSWPRAGRALALVGLGSPAPSGTPKDLTSNCLRSPKISTEAFSEASMSCFAQLKKNSSTGRTGTPAGPKTRDENMSGTFSKATSQCVTSAPRIACWQRAGTLGYVQ